MKALVTGGAGLVGSHLVDLLLARGHSVRVLDSLVPLSHPRGRPPWVPREVEFVEGDVRDPLTVWRALIGVDVAFHQAAAVGFEPEPARLIDVNALGTARLMEAARRTGVRKVVLASSQAVYGGGRYLCPEHGRVAGDRREAALAAGDWVVECLHCDRVVEPLAVREDDAPTPVGAYARSKLYAEQLALELGREWGMPVVALRYALTYGPRQSTSNPYTGICSIFSARLLNGLRPVVYEDGLQARDFTYVGDVAEANLLVAEDPRADGQALNVGTGRATAVLDFARLLAEAYDVHGLDPELPGSYRPVDARHLFADASRLRALGWEPRVPLEEGVRCYAEWILAGPRPESRFAEAEAGLRAAGVVVGGRA